MRYISTNSMQKFVLKRQFQNFPCKTLTCHKKPTQMLTPANDQIVMKPPRESPCCHIQKPNQSEGQESIENSPPQTPKERQKRAVMQTRGGGLELAKSFGILAEAAATPSRLIDVLFSGLKYARCSDCNANFRRKKWTDIWIESGQLMDDAPRGQWLEFWCVKLVRMRVILWDANWSMSFFRGKFFGFDW